MADPNQSHQLNNYPALKSTRRKPLTINRWSILVFQVEKSLSPALAMEFGRNGTELLQVTVPVLRCSERELINESLGRVLEGVKQLELVLVFADYLGLEGRISQSSLAATQQVFSANVLSVKVFLDELFKSDRAIRQVCVLTMGSPHVQSRYPSFGVAVSALEMMLKLYATEQESAHLSMIVSSRPSDQASSPNDLAKTIQSAITYPSGITLDEHGQELANPR